MVALSILLPISEDPSLSPVIDIETMNKAKRGREWPHYNTLPKEWIYIFKFK